MDPRQSALVLEVKLANLIIMILMEVCISVDLLYLLSLN